MTYKSKKRTMGEVLRKLVKEANNGALETQMARDIQWVGLPKPETQYMWHPTRKFRADFAYPAIKLLIEVDGGTWANMGHSRGSGIEKDRIKDVEALILGFKVLRVTGTMVKDGSAIGYLEQIFKGYTNEEKEKKQTPVSDSYGRTFIRDKKSL
jgi:very-short-patch-repair endonuclease